MSELIEVHGGLTEVICIEEFDEKYIDLTNMSTLVYLLYQCLIIREHCLGYSDITIIKYLFVFRQWMLSINLFTEGLSLWLQATEMLHFHLKENVTSDLNDLEYLIEYGLTYMYNSLYNIPQDL